MAKYDFKCPHCRVRVTLTMGIQQYEEGVYAKMGPTCRPCNQRMRRSYSPLPFVMPMPGHMNETVGRYVTGKKDFVDGLHRASDAATERTGILHNFQPIDMRDSDVTGVNEETLADINRTRHDAGKPTVR